MNDEGVVDASKQGYQHFFALLGAASAVTTGHPEARKLLDYTIEIIEKYFWSEEEQMCTESGMKPSAKPKSIAAAMPICTRWKPS